TDRLNYTKSHFSLDTFYYESLLHNFFFNHTANTEIYTLSLHDALPILKNINHTRSSISDDIRNILCSSANMRRAIPQRIFLMSRSEERFSRNAETDLVCRLLLEKKNSTSQSQTSGQSTTASMTI